MMYTKSSLQTKTIKTLNNYKHKLTSLVNEMRVQITLC